MPSRRMNAVVNFYKWAQGKGLIENRLKLWEAQQVSVTFFNRTGFQRTAVVWTTDLRISHRKANVTTVEGGLLPLTSEDRDTLLNYLKNSASELSQVLHVMFVIGFFVLDS